MIKAIPSGWIADWIPLDWVRRYIAIDKEQASRMIDSSSASSARFKPIWWIYPPQVLQSFSPKEQATTNATSDFTDYAFVWTSKYFILEEQEMITKTAPNEAILRARVAAREQATNVARQDSYNLLFDNYREHFEVIAAFVEAGLSVEEIGQELDDIWGKDCIPALKQRMILAAELMVNERE